ncbi:MAG: hypothetical protein ACK6DO_08535 [Planctomycetia bacterium]
MAAPKQESSLVARRWFTPSGAIVAELAPGIDAPQIFARLAGAPRLVFFDSALVDQAAAEPTAAPRLGRHSFVAADPIHAIVVEPSPDAASRIAAALDAVRGLLADLATATVPGLPPFQGGLAGLVSYECGLARLGVAPASPPAAGVPLGALAVSDVVVA